MTDFEAPIRRLAAADIRFVLVGGIAVYGASGSSPMS